MHVNIFPNRTITNRQNINLPVPDEIIKKKGITENPLYKKKFTYGEYKNWNDFSPKFTWREYTNYISIKNEYIISKPSQLFFRVYNITHVPEYMDE